MNKIRVIDLLNKIANGEEVPNKIKWGVHEFKYRKLNESDKYYFCEKGINSTLEDYLDFSDLHEEVEIIEDKQEPKPITKKDLEAIGYAFGEMKKALQNGWDKSLKNEPFKEDKKIEKLEYWVDVHSWVEGEDLKKGLQEQAKFNENIYFKINEIIDVINKGDK